MRLSRKRAKKEWKSDWLSSSAAASLISFTFLSPSCCCCCFYEKVQELYNKNYWLPCFTLNYFFLAILSKKKPRKISRVWFSLVLAKLHDMTWYKIIMKCNWGPNDLLPAKLPRKDALVTSWRKGQHIVRTSFIHKWPGKLLIAFSYHCLILKYKTYFGHWVRRDLDHL